MSLLILGIPVLLKIDLSLFLLGGWAILVPSRVVPVSILPTLLRRLKSCLGPRILTSLSVLRVGRLLFLGTVLVA